MIYKGKLACQISGKLKHHAAASRNAECLYTVHRVSRRRSPINGFKLLADHVISKTDAWVLQTPYRNIRDRRVLRGLDRHDTVMDGHKRHDVGRC